MARSAVLAYNSFMIILGIDYGTKNIGLALSDETELVTVALPIHINRGAERTLTELDELIRAKKVGKILLGVPMTSNETAMAKTIKEFGAQLKAVSGLEVVLWDESYSSSNIEKQMRGKIRKKSDSIVAAALLQEYLDFLREVKI